MDKITFKEACDIVLDDVKLSDGIGTLSEKTVHAVLKYFYCPDKSCHEKRICRYIADIYTGSEIIEIQTRNFNKLTKKLEAYLPEHKVCVVYPLAHDKWLRWVNPETGEISPKRKCPKRSNPYNILRELYSIRDYLKAPNLSFQIVLLDMEEYRLLDGYSKDKKKGATKCDCFPLELVDKIVLSDLASYKYFIPDKLPKNFCAEDYKKLSHLTQRNTWYALQVLISLGFIKQTDKLGKKFIYTIL